jgi:hypothetical protein
MTLDAPDFFLASSKSHLFCDPRHCWVEATVTGEIGSDYLLVRIYPPAIDFRTKQAITRILISGKYKPANLTELPASVYIAKIKDAAVIKTHKCLASEIEVVASGNIFASQKAALTFATSDAWQPTKGV